MLCMTLVLGFIRLNGAPWTSLNMSTSSSYKGAPIWLIYGSESPWNRPDFPPVRPARNHIVLYQVPDNGILSEDRPPKPRNGGDKWDQYHVRLPCSQQSLYPVTGVSDIIFICYRNWKKTGHLQDSCIALYEVHRDTFPKEFAYSINFISIFVSIF